MTWRLPWRLMAQVDAPHVGASAVDARWVDVGGLPLARQPLVADVNGSSCWSWAAHPRRSRERVPAPGSATVRRRGERPGHPVRRARLPLGPRHRPVRAGTAPAAATHAQAVPVRWPATGSCSPGKMVRHTERVDDPCRRHVRAQLEVEVRQSLDAVLKVAVSDMPGVARSDA